MAANVQNVIVLFGDSLTQWSWRTGGLAQRLAADYARKLDVLNRGINGYQTKWAIPVLKQISAKQHEQLHVPKVELLTIWFGANDAAPPPSPQHVSRDEYMQNLTYLIDTIRSPTSPHYSPRTRIILITPPPVNSFQRPERNFDMTKSYAEAAKTTGAALRLPVADVWTEIWEASGKDEKALEKYLCDGLHLNAAGYEIVYNSVMSIIEEKYPEIHYDKLPMTFPPWAEIPKD
ncbi:SGNH hydrolase-type esterase domain-containing protein [Scleroderma yunnanense]